MAPEQHLKGRDLQKGVIDIFRRHGWRVAHFASMQGRDGIWRTPAQADGKGFPDLVCVRDRVVVIEIKGDGDKLRDDQNTWLTAFRMAGIPAYVWTPKEYRSGEVERVAGARRQQPFPVMGGIGHAIPCS